MGIATAVAAMRTRSPSPWPTLHLSPMNRRRYLLLAAAAALVVIALALEEQSISDLGTPSVRLAANPDESFSIMLLAPRPIPSVLQSPVFSSAIPFAERRSVQMASAAPEALYQAYKQVRHCHVSRSLEHLADAAEATNDEPRLQELRSRFDYEAPERACANMTPEFETEALRWVQTAAEAGIPGAARDFVSERAAGDWWNDGMGPGTSVAADYLRQLFEKGAEHGDPDSLAALTRYYAEGKPQLPRTIDGRTEALTYALAWKNALEIGEGAVSDVHSHLAATTTIAALESQMSRYQIEQSQARSRALMTNTQAPQPTR